MPVHLHMMMNLRFANECVGRGSAARGGLQILDVLFASRAFTLSQMFNRFYYCLPQL